MSSPFTRNIEVMLYLSRHGKTRQNKLVEISKQNGKVKYYDPEWERYPDLKDLIPEGEGMAEVLADYFMHFILTPENIKKEDVRIITSGYRRSMDTGGINRARIGLPLENVQSFDELNEQVPKEFNPKNTKSIMEIGDEAAENLQRILSDYDGKVVLAPLHESLNHCFLNSVGIWPQFMGNCSMLPLVYRNGMFTPTGPYISNDDMRSRLEDNVSGKEVQ